jgi:hypothetical protein
VKTIVLYLAAVWVAGAQIGIPGGGYPPGTPGGYPYPGGGGRIPGGVGLPGRTGKAQPPSTAGQPLPNFRGKLKQMDAKSLSLELDDNRVLDFTINAKTKFFKNGDEVKSPKFNPGDQLSVEGPQDAQGYLTAVNVYWEKAAAAGDQAKKDGGVDTWKDAKEGPPPKDAPNSVAKEPPARGTPSKDTPDDAVEDVALPPPPADPDRPVLKRGRPAQRPSDPVTDTNLPAGQPSSPRTAPPTDVALNLPPNAGSVPDRFNGPPPEDQTPLGSHQEDPLIVKATDAALEFTETLPNYVVQEMISRYQSERQPADWTPVDVVSMDLVYENHKEDYRNIKVNGKPVNKKMEELGGAWSSGEFGTILINLFAPASQTEFHARRDGRIAGVNARIYEFEVKRENSNWTVKMGAQTFVPGYGGSIWIDPKNGRVLRIEMQARGLPSQFPSDHVETALDYEYVRLGGTEQFLLPTHSENLACQRGTALCSKNSIDFRNYHKYSGESTIEFHEVK